MRRGALARPVSAVADAFQLWNRRRKLTWLTSFVAEQRVRSVLLVGAGGTERYPWEMLVEKGLAGCVDVVVWSGLETEPAEQPYVAADALHLPFRDGSFDLVFSNAVLEHVGGAASQEAFVAEHARVGRHWALTTPNRWFPVEPHTRTALRHWSSSWRSRRTEFTRLLSRSELESLLPSSAQLGGGPFSPTFTAYGGHVRAAACVG